MAKSLLHVIWPNRQMRSRPEWSVASERRVPVRAGAIGPIRREIIFEPVHEQPVPVEPTPAAPETPPKEPVPDPS